MEAQQLTGYQKTTKQKFRLYTVLFSVYSMGLNGVKVPIGAMILRSIVLTGKSVENVDVVYSTRLVLGLYQV